MVLRRKFFKVLTDFVKVFFSDSLSEVWLLSMCLSLKKVTNVYYLFARDFLKLVNIKPANFTNQNKSELINQSK